MRKRIVEKYSIILLFIVLVSCRKEYSTTIGAISGPSRVCYGEKHVEYSVVKDPQIDYVLWTVPEGATIVSGQGSASIKVNFGIKQGSICASFYKNGERSSGVECLDVTFGVPGKWCRIRDYEGDDKEGAVAFVAGNKAYVATGIHGDASLDDVCELNTQTYTWTKKNDFIGSIRNNAIAFSIGGKGYVGIGSNLGVPNNDFYEYDEATDSWQQKANFPSARDLAFAFTINNKGYVGGGRDLSGFFDDFYEYNHVSNEWVAKADLPGQRVGAVGFALGTKGYMGLGYDGSYKKDFWEYDPADISNGFDINGNPLGKWNAKADFPGIARYQAAAFSIDNSGYVGTGTDGTMFFNDFYRYDPVLNEWIQKDSIPNGRAGAVGFSVGNKGYIGTGYIQETNIASKRKKDFWVYTQE